MKSSLITAAITGALLTGLIACSVSTGGPALPPESSMAVDIGGFKTTATAGKTDGAFTPLRSM